MASYAVVWCPSGAGCDLPGSVAASEDSTEREEARKTEGRGGGTTHLASQSSAWRRRERRREGGREGRTEEGREGGEDDEGKEGGEDDERKDKGTKRRREGSKMIAEMIQVGTIRDSKAKYPLDVYPLYGSYSKLYMVYTSISQLCLESAVPQITVTLNPLLRSSNWL